MSKTAARRKSDNGGSGGGGAPAPAHAHAPEPATVAAGRAFLGRRVEKVFVDEALGRYRPFGGEITDVMTSVRRPDGTVDKRVYFFVR
jgi:hypothetical protein